MCDPRDEEWGGAGNGSALVGLRYARAGRVVACLELGVRGAHESGALEQALREQLFALRVQLVRWETELRDGIRVHQLGLEEFDAAPLSLSRKGSVLSEPRRVASDVLSAAITETLSSVPQEFVAA